MVEGVFKIPVRLLVALLLSSKQGQMVNAVITVLFLIWRIFMKKQTQRKYTFIHVKLLVTQELFGMMIKSGFSTESQWNSKKFQDLPHCDPICITPKKESCFNSKTSDGTGNEIFPG